MNRLADLHVHTALSDGTFSPEKVVEYAKAKGLYAIAITDHDCCDGIAPAMKRAKELGMEIIPGVELSTEMDEQDVHVLGYFINWQDRVFLDKLKEIVHVRKERAKEILRRLRKIELGISDEELFELSGFGCVGRLHIAHLLVRKGYVSSISDAFKAYIGNSGPCYVKKFRLSPQEAVGMIKDAEGIAVLAHPKSIGIKDRSTDDIVGEFAASGIQGIEVYHSEHTTKDEDELNALAEKYKLLITGGSDCHGLGKNRVLIGKVKVPYDLVEKMKSHKSKQ